jgi:hypothetical protein
VAPRRRGVNDAAKPPPFGGPLRPNQLHASHFKPVLKRAGLPDTRFHDLQHTSAALLLVGVHPTSRSGWTKPDLPALDIDSQLFQLRIQERGSDGAWTTSAPSSANLRALALCFVSALIKLAVEIQ